MVFLTGPRQVGKTTISRTILDEPLITYLNWDVKEHRAEILKGAISIGNYLNLQRAQETQKLIVFDELHKYKNWRDFLKGFYDLYKNDIKIIVTGSAKLNVYNQTGDSLMGRYFPYRVHPLSVAELIRTRVPSTIISSQQCIDEDKFESLWNFGGYPDPFLKNNAMFTRRWCKLRYNQLFKDDIRDLTQIHEVAQLEMLAELLKHNSGTLVNYTDLSNKIDVGVNTIKRWITALKNFYFCFTIKPWHKNIQRSLLKEPKIYLWDWVEIKDTGMRVENFVACHLLKAIHFWNDMGFGDFGLYFIRDKEKREVDFLVTKNEKPWLLLEVKNSGKQSLSEHLYRFAGQLNPEHVLQAAFNLPYENIDCFSYKKPVIVPLKTFLSQLV